MIELKQRLELKDKSISKKEVERIIKNNSDLKFPSSKESGYWKTFAEYVDREWVTKIFMTLESLDIVVVEIKRHVSQPPGGAAPGGDPFEETEYWLVKKASKEAEKLENVLEI